MRGCNSRSGLKMKTKHKKIMVTGGCGFIGSHFIRYLLAKYKNIKVVNVDLLTYAGNPENVKDVAGDPRYRFYKTDIGDFNAISRIIKKEGIDSIVNFAAESDNNKAVSSPIDFAKTNALGTASLLEAARQNGVKRFHHISTCEVFGQLPLNSKATFSEKSPLNPRTPYNASKASADHIVRSYHHTFGLPVTISHCANNYGSHQFPEKVIPVFIIKALKNEPLPVFKSSKNRREWIHVLDHCRAVDLILQKGKIGEAYNIGSGLEKSVTQIAKEILQLTKRPASLIKIVPDRPGHDTRYLLTSAKIKKELGWKTEINWEQGLKETVDWYINNQKWWKPLLAKSHSWK